MGLKNVFGRGETKKIISKIRCAASFRSAKVLDSGRDTNSLRPLSKWMLKHTLPGRRDIANAGWTGKKLIVQASSDMILWGFISSYICFYICRYIVI